MAGLMIYLPYGCVDAQQGLNFQGLGDLLDPGINAICTPVAAHGPDDGHGTLITFEGPQLADMPRCIEPATQEWHPSAPIATRPVGRFWVGWLKEHRPTPEDLQREDYCAGQFVRLRDGQQWLVPVADYLPRRITYSMENGNEIRVPATRHKDFTLWANKQREFFMSDGFIRMLKQEIVTIPDALSGAKRALAKNYRITDEIIDKLELIEDTEIFQIVSVVIGAGHLIQYLKEKKNANQSGRPTQSQ